MLEFDLHFSRDKEVVVIHDAMPDQTTNGTGKVREYTLEELKRLDAGGWLNKAYEGVKIPTLAELCELVAAYPDVLLNVEVKRGPDMKEAMDAAARMLQECGIMERCVFACFDAEVLAYMHDVHGVRAQGFPGGQMSNYAPGDDGQRPAAGPQNSRAAKHVAACCMRRLDAPLSSPLDGREAFSLTEAPGTSSPTSQVASIPPSSCLISVQLAARYTRSWLTARL